MSTPRRAWYQRPGPLDDVLEQHARERWALRPFATTTDHRRHDVAGHEGEPMSDQADTRSAAELLLARRKGEDVTDEQLRATFKREQDHITALIDARRARHGGGGGTAAVGDHPIDVARRERAERRG